MSEQAPCTKEDAITAVKAQAFEVTDEESSEFGRRIVHCYAGPFGADWDEVDAIAFIMTAKSVQWVQNVMKHNLMVSGPLDNGDHGVRYFDIKGPEGQS